MPRHPPAALNSLTKAYGVCLRRQIIFRSSISELHIAMYKNRRLLYLRYNFSILKRRFSTVNCIFVKDVNLP